MALYRSIPRRGIVSEVSRIWFIAIKTKKIIVSMKNLSKALLSALLALLLVQCQTDEVRETVIEEQIPQGETVTVSGNIKSDVTWASGNTYILNELVVVEEGATLTIEPCVVVKASDGPTGLLISRGAQIDAQGDASCPVIFTSTEDQLEPGEVVSPNLTGAETGLWGGIFILGNAPVSSFSSTNMVPISPQSPLYSFGGAAPADNSGTFRYVSIRHTGFETAQGEVPSGLYLAGVGSGTTIDHVELYANTDDGFKVEGGTVDVSDVVTSFFLDDAFDVDKGYAGTMENLIGIGVGSGNSSLELDGGESAANPSFTIRNASFKGSQSGEDYIDFQRDVNCLIANAYFFSFDADSRVKLDRDEDAANWLAEQVDVANMEFNVSHLNSGNTTISAIFVDDGTDAENAFALRAPDASIVQQPSTGADKDAFAEWTVAGQNGSLDDF